MGTSTRQRSAKFTLFTVCFTVCPETHPAHLHPYLHSVYPFITCRCHLRMNTALRAIGCIPLNPGEFCQELSCPQTFPHCLCVPHAILAPGGNIYGSTLWGVKENTSQHHTSLRCPQQQCLLEGRQFSIHLLIHWLIFFFHSRKMFVEY